MLLGTEANLRINFIPGLKGLNPRLALIGFQGARPGRHMNSSQYWKFLWNFLNMDVMIINKHHKHETIQPKIIKIVSLHTLLVTHIAFSEVLTLVSVELISSFYSYCISSLAALPLLKVCTYDTCCLF